ncbi:MAG: twin-arginine translocation signal domain-containing protein [Acidobacteriaceae bacterium]
MTMDALSRRSFLKNLGAAGALAYSTGAGALDLPAAQADATANPYSASDKMQNATRAQRMACVSPIARRAAAIIC